ncbi:12905_t:CDS:10, partial [Acaulospora morrowiae]
MTEGMMFNDSLDPLDLLSRIEQEKNGTETHATSFFGQNTFNLEEERNYVSMIPELYSRPVDVLLESLPDLQNAFQVTRPSSEEDQTNDSLGTESNQEFAPEISPSVWDVILNYKDHDINRTSPYLTEADIATYESVWHNHFHHEFSYGNTGVVVDQELLIQNILNLVIGIPSTLFYYDPTRKIFSPKISNIRIRGCSAKSMSMMMIRFLNLGTHIKRLENAAERCMKSAPIYGLTGVAFGRSLSSFISLVRKSTIAMFEKHEVKDNTRIVGLYHVMDEVSFVVEKIAAFCRCDVADSRSAELSPEQSDQREKEGFYLPFGSGTLSEIYTTAESIDSTRSPFLKSTLLAFLKQSSEPFFQMLNSWLGIFSPTNHDLLPIDAPKGDFRDPYKEFFIVNFEIDASFVKHDGNCFWHDGVQVSDKNLLPAFIDAGLARDVLEAGKSLRLLRDYQPDHPLCHAGTMLNPITSKSGCDINMKWLFIQGDIDEMQDQLQNYFRAVTIAIVAQDERRKSKIARAQQHYQHMLSKKKQEIEFRLLKKKESKKNESMEMINKKNEWRKSIEQYLVEKKQTDFSLLPNNFRRPEVESPLEMKDIEMLVDSPQEVIKSSLASFEEKTQEHQSTAIQDDGLKSNNSVSNMEDIFDIYQNGIESSAFSGSENNDSTIVLLERLLQIQSSISTYAHKEYILPLGAITELVIRRTLLCHCRLINASILSIFFHDLGLRAHLNVLRDFMLMGNGSFVSGLTDALFSDNVDRGESSYSTNYNIGTGVGIRLNSRQTWPPTGVEWKMALNAVKIEAIMSERKLENDNQSPINVLGNVNDLDNMLMFGIRSGDASNSVESLDPNSLEALDFLYLEYKAPYPINVIITPNVLQKYNTLFTFLLRVLRLSIVVRHIYRLSHDRCNPVDNSDELAENIKLMHRFQFEAQQFVFTLHGYMFDIAISATWKHFMKRLNKISEESEFELPREHLWGRTSNSDAASYYDGQSDTRSEEVDDEPEGDAVEGDVKDLESLRAYHEHVLDRMFWQCLLETKQKPLAEFLNRILKVILEFAQQLRLRYRRYNSEQREEYWNEIKTLYIKFRKYTAKLVNCLMEYEEKGGGRLGLGIKRCNIGPKTHKTSGKSYHDKIDNQSGVRGFLQELLVRLDFNGHYARVYADE